MRVMVEWVVRGVCSGRLNGWRAGILEGSSHWRTQRGLEGRMGQRDRSVRGLWNIVHPPEGVNILLCSIVFKTKYRLNNEVVERWVRIVVGGHRQKKGVDCTKSFHAAAKMPSTYVTLGHAVKHDWKIIQVDVKSAYLNLKIDHPTSGHTYIEGMAKKFGLFDAKLVHVPMLLGEILTKEQCLFTPSQHATIQGVPYGKMIGHIL